jgi:TonB-dependent SusC/RagA subfamily outer membrane receptor
MRPTSSGSRTVSELCCVALLGLAAGCGGAGNGAVANSPTLEPDEYSLGYTTEKRAQGTGSVSSLDSQDIEQTRSPHLQEVLSRVPGVQVSRRPDGSFSIQIRGARSFTGSNEPLFVVNGVILQDFGSFSAADAINPADVERIDVLKDASSLAMYGSRGANGVIIITTKR